MITAIWVQISVDHSILKISASICWENLVKTKFLQNDFQVVRCLGWLVSFQNITLSTANDNVENNKHLNPLGLEPWTLCVLGARDNHYTTEYLQGKVYILLIILNWSITKKKKIFNGKFSYRQTVYLKLFSIKWPTA